MANEKDKEGRRNDGEVERKGCGRRESGANRDIGKQGAARDAFRGSRVARNLHFRLAPLVGGFLRPGELSNGSQTLRVV